MRRTAKVAFWASAGALVYAQAGSPLLGAARARRRGAADEPSANGERAAEPTASLIVAAHREADVIADKVRNARALDWPADRLEVIVACDGSPDDTPARARAAGADRVLELPWGGKGRAQDAAGRAARGGPPALSGAHAPRGPGAPPARGGR